MLHLIRGRSSPCALQKTSKIKSINIQSSTQAPMLQNKLLRLTRQKVQTHPFLLFTQSYSNSPSESKWRSKWNLGVLQPARNTQRPLLQPAFRTKQFSCFSNTQISIESKGPEVKFQQRAHAKQQSSLKGPLLAPHYIHPKHHNLFQMVQQ